MEKPLKKLFVFVSIFFVAIIFIGCSKTEKSESKKTSESSKSEKRKTEHIDFKDTFVYESDNGKNVVDIKLMRPCFYTSQENLRGDEEKFSVIYRLICRSGEIDPKEFTGKSLMVIDENGHILKSVHHDFSLNNGTKKIKKLPKKLKIGEDLIVSHIYVTFKKVKNVTLKIKNAEWSGYISNEPESPNK